MVDVAIIGGGVCGCSLLYELSRYDVDVVLLEKGNDVSVGTTKATLSGKDGTAGNVLKYRLGSAAASVSYGQNVRNWPNFTEGADITATTGQVLTVVEADQYYKAVASGSNTVVVNAGD